MGGNGYERVTINPIVMNGFDLYSLMDGLLFVLITKMEDVQINNSLN